jgi:hypothetical protein
MTIIRNTFTQDTAYFSSHIPLTLGSDEELVTALGEMISYSIIPASGGTVINQPFGAENLYSFNIRIKNLTKNVSLQIELITEELLFEVSRTGNFILRPAESRDLLIAIDEGRFNALGAESQINELLQMKIENLDNGTYAIKNLSLNAVSVSTLPTEIDVE